MIKKFSKTTRCCGLCRNFNKGLGPQSLKVDGLHFVSFDEAEKQQCSVNGFIKSAWQRCEKFSPRF